MKDKSKFNIIIVVVVVLFTISTVPKTFQEDTYYMIKVGEYICQNGIQVIYDKIEPFAWIEGITYTYPHWLIDTIFYQIYNIFDFLGIYIFTVLVAIVIYLLIYYTNIKVSKNYEISAVITIASIYMLKEYMAARAQIITIMCLVLEILCIEIFLETGKKRYIIELILDSIILANCHAALFPIYLVIYLPYIVEYLITFITKENLCALKIRKIEKKILKLKKQEQIIKKQTKLDMLRDELKLYEKKEEQKIIIKRNQRSKWLLLIFIICICAGLLTPLGDIPYTYTLKSIIGNTMNFIVEHSPVVLINDYNLLFMFAVIIALLFSNKTKVKLADVIMLMGMSLLALISYKQFAIFFICTMCIINKLLFDRMQNDSKNTMKKIDNLLSKLLKFKEMTYVILLIVIIAIIGYRSIASQSYVDTKLYPTLASKWLKENVDIDNMRLFNDFNYGSYLLFQDIPVFIDGRADVYDPVFNKKEDDVFLDYMKASSLQVWYEDVLKKYDITHIITNADSNLNIYLGRNSSYRMLYNDGDFTIYEARDYKS